MESKAFYKSIKKHNLKENYIGSALARKYKANLHFNSSENLSKWDYLLYSLDDSWLCSCEQKEDNVCASEDDNLCFELFTFNQDGTKRLGAINKTKAKYIIYVITKMKLILSLDTKKVKDLIALHQSEGVLKTYVPNNFDAWRAKHDTAPTECALINYNDVVLAAQSSVFHYNDLNINSIIYNGF
jgi:hypothetical protein